MELVLFLPLLLLIFLIDQLLKIFLLAMLLEVLVEYVVVVLQSHQGIKHPCLLYVSFQLLPFHELVFLILLTGKDREVHLLIVLQHELLDPRERPAPLLLRE